MWIVKNCEDKYYYARPALSHEEDSWEDAEKGWWWINDQKECTIFRTKSTACLVAECLLGVDARVVRLRSKYGSHGIEEDRFA